jgi:hypothetical protein
MYGRVEPLEELLASGGAIAVFAVVGVAAGAWMLVSQLRSVDDAEVRIANDRLLDPRRAWVQGATFVLQRLHDNAYVEEDVIRAMLSRSWGIDTAAELDATVARLAEEESHAWGLTRAMLLLRSAVAVGWIDNDTSFDRCYALGAVLQSRYDGWDAMVADLLHRRRTWKGLPEDGSRDDADMAELLEVVAELRRSIWKQTSWSRPLTAP